MIVAFEKESSDLSGLILLKETELQSQNDNYKPENDMGGQLLC